MEIWNLTMAQLKNTIISDTGFIQLPNGTTAERPVSASNGMIRYNTTLGIVEQYDATYNSWFPSGYLPPIATGGAISEIGGYKIHSFTTVGTDTFTITRLGIVEYLIVAGGGSGGNNKAGGFENGGGGGAGGVLTGLITLTPQEYTVNVGSGGVIPGGNGQTVGSNSSVFNLTAFGGGGGSTRDNQLNINGGSGGGAVNWSPPTVRGGGVAGQGNAGGIATSVADTNGGSAGGGGAGSEGINGVGFFGGRGGSGISSNISGTSTFYAGGGGGGGGTGGSGGQGGGGAGGSSSSVNGISGTANTGGGGGGNWAETGNAGNGGSGIVVIRYRIS
jgi:hypothetical protein